MASIYVLPKRDHPDGGLTCDLCYRSTHRLIKVQHVGLALCNDCLTRSRISQLGSTLEGMGLLEAMR